MLVSTGLIANRLSRARPKILSRANLPQLVPAGKFRFGVLHAGLPRDMPAALDRDPKITTRADSRRQDEMAVVT